MNYTIEVAYKNKTKKEGYLAEIINGRVNKLFLINRTNSKVYTLVLIEKMTVKEIKNFLLNFNYI